MYLQKIKRDGHDRFYPLHGKQLPIIVFDMNKPGNLMSVVTGEKVGTLVS